VLGNVDCGLLRDDGDGNATVVAASGDAISASFPVGARVPVEGDGVVASVLGEGRPHRIDDYAAAGDVLAEGARERGIGSAVGCPVVVRGGTWGALVVATSGARPCPPETERRIAQFADLVATAIGNAEARAEVSRLANEQAALRRVATLVAQGTRPAEVFAAVSEEVGRLFGSDTAAVFRFEHDEPAMVVVGTSRKLERTILGMRLEIDEPLATAEVYRTGRSARVDNWDRVPRTSAVADEVRRLGVASTVASPIVVEGRRWGAVSVASTGEPLPLDASERLERFGELVATALANTDSRLELAASRKRIVAASDEARRRIERDLHDGTQQRLVSLGLAVRAAEADIPDELSGLRSELSRVASGLGNAVAELQEISRGIHPAILGQGGLAPALRTLARRSAIPVELDLRTDARLPAPIEVAAYYVASEALANAAKHGQASRIEISLVRRDGSLRLSIRDDGVGGADPTRGSGLVGLTDRVEALGGSIQIESGPGEGTQVTAELPVELESGA
jgi:signal transduction histidine kinase